MPDAGSVFLQRDGRRMERHLKKNGKIGILNFRRDEYACTTKREFFCRGWTVSMKMMRSVFYGLLTIYLIAALFSLIFSLLLSFTSLHESSLEGVVTAFSFLLLFIGGFVAGGKGKEKGWILGALTGVFYAVINFMFQFLGRDSGFTLEQTAYYTFFLLAATAGGVFGVNASGKRSKKT